MSGWAWASSRDPGLAQLRKATRVALVLPAFMAFGLFVVGDDQFALYGAFGVFAMLAFADFNGPLARRARAYVVLAVVGAVIVAFGTVVSTTTAGAVAGAVVVVALLQYVAVFGGYWAAAVLPATLAYVLAASVPASDLGQVVPQSGGWLASGLVCAVVAVALWPARPRHLLRRDLAAVVDRLAAVLRGWARGEAAAASDEAAAGLVTASHQLMVSWGRTRLRPGGPATQDQALAYLLQEVRQVAALVRSLGHDATGAPPPPEDVALLERAAATAADAARLLRGEGDDVDLEGLEEVRAADLAALEARVRGGLAAGEGEATLTDLERAWAVRMLAHGVMSIAANARLVDGGTVDPTRYQPPPLVPAVEGAWARGRRILAAHLSWRSAWSRNVVRATVALAVAVAASRLLDVEHGFWVVLGTLSVLRSSASGTAVTAAQALLGTVVGFVVTLGVLTLVVGESTAALWVALALSAFLSAWTPTVVHFVVGQASFTLFVVVLFNLVDPAGWQTGVVRVENIALGAAVALVVGVALWPRGVAAQLGSVVGEAYRRAEAYAARGFTAALNGDPAVSSPDRPGLARSRSRAAMAAMDADDAALLALSDGHQAGLPVEDLLRLLVGVARLRHTGDALGWFVGGPVHRTGCTAAAQALEAAAGRVGREVEDLAGELDGTRPAPPAPPGDPAPVAPGGAALLASLPGTSPPLPPEVAPVVRACLADQVRAGADPGTLLTVVFAARWLGFTCDVVALAGPSAGAVARLRDRPWWR